MASLSYEDNVKLMRFEMAEAQWVHEDIIRPHLYKWVDRIILNVVEHKKYGIAGRFFHFIVEYFYISKYLRIRIKRNRHTSLVGGKGFRPGSNKTRLDRVSSTVLKRGKEIATKDFNIGIIN